MTDLTLLHESTVDEAEIDTLGHLNVRYYVERAARANELLYARLGMSDLGPGRVIRRIDTYNRFHREQFAHATLHTLGGLVTSSARGGEEALTTYVEVRNADTRDLASTFIIRSQVVDLTTQQLVGAAAPAADLRDTYAVEIPHHGSPRSLSLDSPKVWPLAELERRIPPADAVNLMTGRHEGLVAAEHCDENGRLREDVELMFVLHSPGEDNPEEPVGPPVLVDGTGRRYSWAIMETRSVAFQRPSAGDVIVSIGTDLNFGEKWRQSRRWVANQASGTLLGVHDHVALCLDLETRRAIPIPADVKRDLASRCRPELA